MKFFNLVLAMIMSLTSLAQYQYYRTKIECTTATKEEVAKGYDRLQEVLDNMNAEKKVFGFYPEKSEKGKSTVLSFEILAENDAAFKAIVAEWMNRTKSKEMESFWKGCPLSKDTLVNTSKLYFPAIKNPGAPVAEVPIIDEKPDPHIEYKIVYDFTAFPKVEGKEKMDSSKVNSALEEVARQFNLHVAAGIPREKIKMVLVIHAWGSRSFLINEEYKKRFKHDNPNLALINDLTNAGVKIVQCGQSAVWMGLKKEMFVPQVKIALSAKTAISSLQMNGYALLKMNND